MSKTKKKLTAGEYKRAILDNTKDADLIVKINTFTYMIEEYIPILKQVIQVKEQEILAIRKNYIDSFKAT